MKKLLIANRGENARNAGVSSHGRACAAGCGDLATLSMFCALESK